MRAREAGLACGSLKPGASNSMADVPGVMVGHVTLHQGEVHTGVTAVLPHGGNLFRDKVVAAAAVVNGFGKSVGLVQVDELGVLETPVLLTNTFGVGTCADALIRHAVAADPDIGRTTSTVNPVVLECNDGYLNDIQAMAVTQADAMTAIASASTHVEVGSVGAGTGMSCFGFKGGIGSASRRISVDGRTFHLGVLTLANFGRAGDLRLPDGRHADPRTKPRPEHGSCIVVLATDVPLEHRQLRRVALRAGAGLAWCGSFWGHGSGDIALAFSTANRVPHDASAAILPQHVLAEGRIDRLFLAAAEAVQESVYDALIAAGPMTGRDGHARPGLADYLGAGIRSMTSS